MRRQALTLIEILLVLAIIGVLIALLVPAVQSAREASRRMQCSSHLRQLGLALHQYADQYGVLPRASSRNYSLHVRLLPFIEQQSLYSQFDLSANAIEFEGPLESQRVKVLECPSDGSSFFDGPRYLAATNYFGNMGTGSQRYGYNGLFALSSEIPGAVQDLPLSAITDGLSQTAMLAEAAAGNGSAHPRRCMWVVSNDGTPERFDTFVAACGTVAATSPTPTQLRTFVRGRPWAEVSVSWMLYNHVLPPNAPSCWSGQAPQHAIVSSTSLHNSIVNVALADGSVQAINDSIELIAWRALGSRIGDP